MRGRSFSVSKQHALKANYSMRILFWLEIVGGRTFGMPLRGDAIEDYAKDFLLAIFENYFSMTPPPLSCTPLTSMLGVPRSDNQIWGKE